MTKWSDYGQLSTGTIASTDTFIVRDISDNSMAATGTQKEYDWKSMLVDLASPAGLSALDEDNMSAGSDLIRGSIEFVIDGGGSVISTGIKGDIEVPFNCEIRRCTVVGDTSGTIRIDVWKDTYANFPPLVGDSIFPTTQPKINSTQRYQSTTIASWTSTISAGDILRYNVSSAVTNIQRCTISLLVEK